MYKIISILIMCMSANCYSLSQEMLEKHLKELPKTNKEIFAKEAQIFKDLKFNIKGLTAISKLEPKNRPGAAPDWGTEIFESKFFENLTFDNCNFQWLNFVNANFKNITFSNCNLEGVVFDGAVFSNVKFVNCNLRNASFYGAKLNDVLFEKTEAPFVNFMQADLQNVTFSNNFLEGSNFFAANANSIKFEGDTKNVLFYDLAKIINLKVALEKPVILISWNDKKPGLAAAKIVDKIQKLGGIPFKFNTRDPEIDPSKLKLEVDDILKRKDITTKTYRSLPQKILAIAKEGDYPEIAKIQKKAHLWINAVSGVLLPGGEDIHPFFYGQEPAPQTDLTHDLRRDLFEFAILDELEVTKTPLLGICRGMQVGNIWHGGTLNQHVPGHLYFVQEYELVETIRNNPSSSVIAKIINNSVNGFKGYAFHHQTIKDVGAGLTVIATSSDGTIKAMEKLGNQFEVYVQWHPEFKGDFSTPESIELEQKLSLGNQEIYQQFIDAAKMSDQRFEHQQSAR